VALAGGPVAVLGGYHAAVHITPQAPLGGSGVSLSATSIDAALDLSVGHPPVTSASVTGLSLTTAGTTITVPNLPLPFPAGFDLANPAATLGIGVADLEQLLCGLVEQALASQFGSTGVAWACPIALGRLPGRLLTGPATVPAPDASPRLGEPWPWPPAWRLVVLAPAAGCPASRPKRARGSRPLAQDLGLGRPSRIVLAASRRVISTIGALWPH